MDVRDTGGGSHGFRRGLRSNGHLMIFTCLHYCGVRKLSGSHSLDGSADTILHCIRI